MILNWGHISSKKGASVSTDAGVLTYTDSPFLGSSDSKSAIIAYCCFLPSFFPSFICAGVQTLQPAPKFPLSVQSAMWKLPLCVFVASCLTMGCVLLGALSHVPCVLSSCENGLCGNG